MHIAYLIVLVAAFVAVVVMVARRLLQLAAGPRPAVGRQLNEWAWTLIPLLVLVVLLWRAFA